MISLEIFQQLAQSTNDVIVVTPVTPLAPPGPIVVYVNPAFTALTGYEPNEIIGHSTRLLHGPNTDPKTTGAARRTVVPGATSISFPSMVHLGIGWLP